MLTDRRRQKPIQILHKCFDLSDRINKMFARERTPSGESESRQLLMNLSSIRWKYVIYVNFHKSSHWRCRDSLSLSEVSDKSSEVCLYSIAVACVQLQDAKLDGQEDRQSCHLENLCTLLLLTLREKYWFTQCNIF